MDFADKLDMMDDDCDIQGFLIDDPSMTNADHIRSMSDEELAYFIKCCMFNDFKPACKKATFFTAQHRPECEELCVNCIGGWLRQPWEDAE